jgi:hypothetical protein
MMSFRSCCIPPRTRPIKLMQLFSLEGAPCYTIGISERCKVGLEIDLQVVRAKAENTTMDAMASDSCLCSSALTEPRVVVSGGRHFETAKADGRHREELEAVFEESLQRRGGASRNLPRVLVAGSERPRQTLGNILPITVECYNRSSLLVASLRPEGRFRNGWRGT